MMKQIILASKSKARAELLKKCGFKFKICVPNVKEIKPRNVSLIKQVVIRNAVLKAEDAGKHFRDGVVIGADTLVLQDKVIFGKPANKREAFTTIKRLSSKPSYVYTGISVLDIRSRKTYTDYAVTKVWVSKLSNKEISKYLFRRDNAHLNFAGGFDAQGKGSLFIERIEGCFYNVVGLPLAKLYKLLHKCKISI